MTPLRIGHGYDVHRLTERRRLVLGGVAYTVGVIFYRQKEKPYRHGIWHFFVLAGTTLHFFTVYLSCCG